MEGIRAMTSAKISNHAGGMRLRTYRHDYRWTANILSWAALKSSGTHISLVSPMMLNERSVRYLDKVNKFVYNIIWLLGQGSHTSVRSSLNFRMVGKLVNVSACLSERPAEEDRPQTMRSSLVLLQICVRTSLGKPMANLTTTYRRCTSVWPDFCSSENASYIALLLEIVFQKINLARKSPPLK